MQKILAQPTFPQGAVRFCLVSRCCNGVFFFPQKRFSQVIKTFLTSVQPACVMAVVKAAGLEKVLVVLWQLVGMGHSHPEPVLVSVPQTRYSLFALLAPCGVSRGIPFPCAHPASLLNRVQPRASRQEPRVSIQSRGQAGALMLSLSMPLTPAFVIALLWSKLLNYSALCNLSLTSDSPFSMVLTSEAWLFPEKKSISSLLILSLSDINLIRKLFVLFLQQMLK